MNQVLQSGQHPDADQLSAFAEHALPPHEQQQTLAHLSICADCRAIVYLAQIPELAAVAAPQLVPARRPWFSGWTLAIPAAFTLAALVLVTVHLRKVSTDHQQAASDKTARLEQPASPPQQPPAAASSSQQTAQLEAAPEPLLAPVVKPEAALPASRPAPLIQPPMLALRPPEPNSINGSLAGQRAPVFPRAAAGISSASTSADEARSIQGAVFKSNAQIAAASPAPANSAATPQATLRSADAARRELHSSATQFNSIAGAAQSDFGQAVPAAPPPPPPSAVSETVTVTSAAPVLDTESAALGQVLENQAYDSLPVTNMKAKKRPALPSHLPTISTIANAQQQLAIDAAGSLFRSQDAGVTWQPISIQWTGRAVKVQLAISPDANKVAKSAASIAAAKAAPATPSQPGFELTTDAREVWISSDGQTWKRK
jgi:Putative zinc-finger